VLPDPTGRRGIDEVAALRVPWGSAPALRRRRPGRCVYWARVRVQSQLGEAAEYVLAADRWERVDLYLRDARGEWAVQRSGWSVPLLARPVQSATPVLRLPLPAGLARTLYFRFESDMGDSVTPASFSVVAEP